MVDFVKLESWKCVLETSFIAFFKGFFCKIAAIQDYLNLKNCNWVYDEQIFASIRQIVVR